MDLCFNGNAHFTQWATSIGLPRQPLVVVDVGVQGGEHPNWRIFGERLVIHGFDAIREVIDTLAATGRRNRHYHWLALGDRDGEEEFFFNAADPYSSSLYEQAVGRYAAAGARRDEIRRVPVRRLDGLVENGQVPQPDFLKVDVEGYEKRVLLGARTVMSAGLLAFEAETSMSRSPEYPQTHFGALLELANHDGLRVFDIAFNRIPTRSFQAALEGHGMPRVANDHSVGRVATMNVLFCRDVVAERDSPGDYDRLPRPLSADRLIKLMMILESYGLNDIAIDIATCYQTELDQHLDVKRAVDLLANADCRLMDPRVRMERSLSWRITAPLRFARRMLGV